MVPKISVIIPCYNSEATLGLTLESVLNQDYRDWEAIIVNDGSTDTTEEIALKWIEKDKRFKYYSKQNEGLGKTRNFGIDKAQGVYILPLDSDNLVEQDFICNAVKILETHNEIGVVHGDAEFFGERDGVWKIDEFNLGKIAIDNYIDACAIFRKDIWSRVGGYDEKMPFQGNEDWDFWIALGIINVNFYHLNQLTFKYFVSSKSMIHSFTNQMYESNKEYLVKKYCQLYYKLYIENTILLEQTCKAHIINLKSEKFIINSFLKMFFGFKLFKI
ncbi:MAG: glycosyltransferase family A protein [Bacteroidota bacterium]